MWFRACVDFLGTGRYGRARSLLGPGRDGPVIRGKGSGMVRYVRTLVVLSVALAAFVIVGSASAQRYIVVLKPGHSAQGMVAIQKAGGTVVGFNKLGIVTVASAKPSFQQTLRGSVFVTGVARDAWFGGRAVLPSRFVAHATALNTVPAEQAACASLFSLPPLLGRTRSGSVSGT